MWPRLAVDGRGLTVPPGVQVKVAVSHVWAICSSVRLGDFVSPGCEDRLALGTENLKMENDLGIPSLVT